MICHFPIQCTYVHCGLGYFLANFIRILICKSGPKYLVLTCLLPWISSEMPSDSWNIPTQTQLMCSPQADQILTCSHSALTSLPWISSKLPLIKLLWHPHLDIKWTVPHQTTLTCLPWISSELSFIKLYSYMSSFTDWFS